MNQEEAFVYELVGEGDKTVWHRLTKTGWPTIMVCGDGGWGTDEPEKVNCLECLKEMKRMPVHDTTRPESCWVCCGTWP